MKVLTSKEPFPRWLRDGVVVVGSFDGFHRGHAKVLARARAIAGKEERPLIVATFDPHPARFFDPMGAPSNLSTISQCERLFARAGADAMLIVDYQAQSDRFSADEMVTSWLVGELGAAIIVIGEHFTFGKDREGDGSWLATISARHGSRAEIIPAECDRTGEIISSNRIRSLLRSGECDKATNLLSRPFTIEDKVRHGHKLGRTIGFPTANMVLNEYVRPLYGVYAVRARLPHGRVLDGVANFGIRPMFEIEEELLESHFFDFTGDLYGQNLEIEMIHYLRGEMKLKDMNELQDWINKDVAQARSVLAECPHYS